MSCMKRNMRVRGMVLIVLKRSAGQSFDIGILVYRGEMKDDAYMK